MIAGKHTKYKEITRESTIYFGFSRRGCLPQVLVLCLYTLQIVNFRFGTLSNRRLIGFVGNLLSVLRIVFPSLCQILVYSCLLQFKIQSFV